MDFEGTKRIEKLYHHITQFILKILKVAMRKQSSGPASMKTWGMPSKGVVFYFEEVQSSFQTILPFFLCIQTSCRKIAVFNKHTHTITHTWNIPLFFKAHFKFRDSDFSFTSGGLPLDRPSFKKQYAWKIGRYMEHSPKTVKCSKWSLSVNKSSLPSMGTPLKGENPAQYAVCLVWTHSIPVKQMQ